MKQRTERKIKLNEQSERRQSDEGANKENDERKKCFEK